MLNLILQLGFILFVFYSLGFYFANRIKVYAWVDLLWVMGFNVVILFLALRTNAFLDHRMFLVLIVMFLLWSLRLASHLFSRILKHGEDIRYKNLIQKWDKNKTRNFYFLFLFQGILNLVLSIPLYLTYTEPNQDLSYLQISGLILFILAFSGESLADLQLRHFKKEIQNQNKICVKGLWKYSRHPNYFFEIIIWVSYGLYVSSISPWGLFPALLMYILIRKVTGIPPLEKLALKKYGDEFINYQKATNALIPWFKK